MAAIAINIYLHRKGYLDRNYIFALFALAGALFLVSLGIFTSTKFGGDDYAQWFVFFVHLLLHLGLARMVSFITHH